MIGLYIGFEELLQKAQGLDESVQSLSECGVWKVKGGIDGNALLMTGPGLERIEVDRRDEVTVDDLVVVHPITQLLTVDSQCECGRVRWGCRQRWR